MVLQPTARGVECVANGDVQVLVRVVFAGLPVDHDSAAGHRQVHAYMIDRALPVAPMGSLHHDPAGAQPVREPLKLLSPALNLGLDRGGRIHPTERDLDLCGHHAPPERHFIQDNPTTGRGL